MFNYALAHVMSVLATEKREEKGATAVEYGLIVALIAAVIIGAVVLLGEEIGRAFGIVSDAVEENVPAGP